MSILQLMTGSGKYLELTLVGTYFNSSTTGTGVTIPGAAQAGDVAIILDATANTSGAGTTLAGIPAGWTRIYSYDYNPGTNAYSGQLLFKLLTSTDLNKTYTLTAPAGSNPISGKFCFIYRLSKPVKSVTSTLILNMASESSADRLIGTVKTFTTSSVDGINEVSIAIAAFTARNTLYSQTPYSITPSGVEVDGDLSLSGAYWACRCLTATQDGFYPQQDEVWTALNFGRNVHGLAFLTVSA